MKAPHTNQLTPGADYQFAPIEVAARDITRHAVIECEKAAGGNPARVAQMLLDQAQVMGLAQAMLLKAGVMHLAQGAKGEPPK